MKSVRANRNHWNRTSGVYQADHDPPIGAQPRLRGCFYLPDAALDGVIGEVTGLRVLELALDTNDLAKTGAKEDVCSRRSWEVPTGVEKRSEKSRWI